MKIRVPPLAILGLLVLGIVNVWLLAVVVGELTADYRGTIDKVAWDPDLTGSTESTTARKPLAAHAETLAHPIFAKTRMPFVPPPPPPPMPKIAVPPPIVDPGLVLGGVVIERPVKKAYVFTKTNPSGTWASEGDDFMGWKVESVSSTGITLRQQGRTIELQLYPSK
jgi:hypothetical protein